MNKYLLFAFFSMILFACNSGSSNKNNREAMLGDKVYKLYCVSCHGADGAMGFSGAPNLQKSVLTLEERINMITHGKGVMNAFKGILSKEEIENVAQYIETLRN
jgi:mono/diheme cytochrome c family protein